MRAVRFQRHGDPSVLQVDEVPDPRPPRRDELLVRVEASSVNGTDLGLRRGDLRIATWGRLPIVPGFDLAGTVVACGPQVTAFSPGDRVMALLGHASGGQGELALLRQSRAALAPASCTSAQAAALPLAGLTALQALYGRAGLRCRRTPARVLVIGASGGIGSYAVQLAKLAGAHVTGVASTAGLAHVAGLGADRTVDRTTTDVRALGERWDVVLDTPGLSSLEHVRPLLTPDGVLVSTRPISLDVLRDRVALRGRHAQRCTAVMTQARSQDLTQLAALVDRQDLRVPLDRTFPMDRAADAHRHAHGPAPGKVVITIGEPAAGGRAAPSAQAAEPPTAR